MIRVDLWSDFVCPFCYIGKSELDSAVAELGLENEVEVIYHAFELNPHAPTEPGNSYVESAMAKFPSEEFMRTQMLEPMLARADNLGLTMRFDDLDNQSTLDAHRLAKFAQFYKKDVEFFDTAYELIFVDNAFLADSEVLLKLAADIGLDEAMAKNVIADKNMFLDVVREDEERAMAMGVGGVPFFLINEKYGLSGAQPKEVFKEALLKAKGEDGMVDLSDGVNICGPDGCN